MKRLYRQKFKRHSNNNLPSHRRFNSVRRLLRRLGFYSCQKRHALCKSNLKLRLWSCFAVSGLLLIFAGCLLCIRCFSPTADKANGTTASDGRSLSHEKDSFAASAKENMPDCSSSSENMPDCSSSSENMPDRSSSSENMPAPNSPGGNCSSGESSSDGCCSSAESSMPADSADNTLPGKDSETGTSPEEDTSNDSPPLKDSEAPLPDDSENDCLFHNVRYRLPKSWHNYSYSESQNSRVYKTGTTTLEIAYLPMNIDITLPDELEMFFNAMSDRYMDFTENSRTLTDIKNMPAVSETFTASSNGISISGYTTVFSYDDGVISLIYTTAASSAEFYETYYWEVINSIQFET